MTAGVERSRGGLQRRQGSNTDSIGWPIHILLASLMRWGTYLRSGA
jgi:hypothetical protein